MFRNKITLTLTGLEDRTNPSGSGHPYIPPPPPAAPQIVVIATPIIKPPNMPHGNTITHHSWSHSSSSAFSS